MLKQLLFCLLFITLALSQTYPPIDVNGQLTFNCMGLMLDDTKFASVMTTFRSTYDTNKLKILNLQLDDNKLSTLTSLSLLADYKQLQEFHLSLAENQNLQSVVGIAQVPGSLLEVLSIDFTNDFKIADISAFAADLKNFKYLLALSFTFYGTALDQTSHDALMQAIGKDLYFNLQLLQLNMQGIAINNVNSWKYLSSFTAITNMRIDYQFIDTLTDVEEIVKIAQSLTTLTNFTFYQTCQNYNWLSYLSSMTALVNLELSFLNIDQTNHDKLIADLDVLYSLTTLTLSFDSGNLTSSAGLSKLSKLSYIAALGLTYKNSKIVDISGLSVITKLKDLKELRLVIQEPDVSGISGIDFIQGLKITLFDVSIESQGLSKSYFQYVYTLPALRELYLKISDMTQVDSSILKGIDSLTGLVGLGLDIDDTNIFDVSIINFAKYTSLELATLVFGDNVMKNYDNLRGFSNSKNLTGLLIQGTFGNYSFLAPLNNLTNLQLVSTTPYRACDLSHSYIIIFDQDAGWDCRSCDEECQKCYGPDFSNCLTCSNSYWFDYQCLATCPTGYHPNPVTHTCDKNSSLKFLRW